LIAGRSLRDWPARCDATGLPAGPVNELVQVFNSPQVAERVRLPLALGQIADLIGNPLKLSGTPVTNAKAPPNLGADTAAVLARRLGQTRAGLATLASAVVISGGFNI
jgi:crotonobetainyl-CoA:carnitine CoA-transferase CaiB-like acyl-CoA transferase